MRLALGAATGFVMALSGAAVALPLEEPATTEPVPAESPAFTAGSYDPNPAFPFGRPNPAAPEELRQFDFMVGEFDCNDRLRTPDGAWTDAPAVWNAAYFLNGFGIQDQYWNPGLQTSNIRIYDEASSQWKVTYFQMPPYNSGTWAGGFEGESMVLRNTVTLPDGSEVENRLTFSDITPRGFEWKGESIQGENATPFWTSSCRRRR